MELTTRKSCLQEDPRFRKRKHEVAGTGSPEKKHGKLTIQIMQATF